MRILLVGINYAPELIGVAKYNTELCESLASAGHEVRVVTAPPYYPEWNIPRAYRSWRYQAETINNVSVKRSPIYVPKTPTGAKRLVHHASFALTSAWPVISESLRWRPDVVFSVAPSLMSAAFTAWIARRTGAFSWLHVQDFEVDAAFDLGILSNKGLRSRMVTVERAILRSFDCVSTISPQMLDRLAHKGVDPEKIREFRNWTDTSQISPGDGSTSFRKELHLADADFVGLYSGTMSNKQGLDLIIEAARELQQSDPNVRFVLCGEGPHKATLQGLAAGLTNVQFLGLQADDRFAELLRTADFHLIPQKAEAADLVLPSKLGGIFATGRPVIAMSRPNTGLANEVAGAGLVIPPGDTHALAAAVRTLAGDPQLCSALGKGAREIALSRWDKTAILAALEQTLVASRELRKTATSRLPLSPAQPRATK
ncbi:WcaI family glycosyltransferase [Bradyrhizobium canariense]|uniref:Colanic acid biosynthesis glycosyl transferase WcaI n=1 Tax=Bradyrhizobium canariense TaxID=255045 RepID=A0A1H2BNC2_9BRAD|nr:WcaI family glycosyltransferase [Bradyrhizobium canariense]SDT59698.1 colanic acid biosynthesis glycosyl transferase WcaI [Bradyrhizobium canariense]